MTRTVQTSQRGMIADLLEGRLDGYLGGSPKGVECSPNLELSRILWNVFEIYLRCKTQESRKQLFLMLDELAMKTKNANE